ncbi:MAG: large conductance mechanosensitive channel protein MscL [Dehalococcoidia bacterium]
MDYLREFKAFILRGNVVDLAVAFVIGVAFAAVVSSLVQDLITPIISMVFGERSLSSLDFTINDSVFRYGALHDSVFTFVTIAAAVFVFVVVPVNEFLTRSRGEPPVDPTTQKCPECLSDIPAEARRCAFCASTIEKAAA